MAKNRQHLQAQSSSCIGIAIAFLLLLAISNIHYCIASDQNVTNKSKDNLQGMFVFGTSVVDNGNNNDLNTLAKANYDPYGIDFSLGPTGRFTNGKTVADCIGDLLGLPLIPPFVDLLTEGNRIIHGVNYGSGGSGILDNTGSITGEVISLNKQIRNFVEVTLLELQDLIGEKSTKILDKYLFLVAAGNDDFLLNYLQQDANSIPTVPAFVANLTSTYASQLQKLYNVGARKFALLTVYPLGCSPVVKKTASDGMLQCAEKVNQIANYFYEQLILMVDNLNNKLPGSKFIVVNTYGIILNIIKNPVEQGFINTTDPCCELREISGMAVFCGEGGNVCRERNKYVYFDGQHNSEGVNVIIANKAFSSKDKTDVYPLNLQMLIKH